MNKKRVVVAIGGNSLIAPGQKGYIKEQLENVYKTSGGIVELIKDGYEVIITHGNGPQVGNAIRRVELSKDQAYPLPLDVCGAQTQGEMGYIISQSLSNLLKKQGINKKMAVILTQVLVSKSDQAFKNPTKPIGSFYKKEEIEQLAKENNWHIKEDAGRGWRRVVPSPEPLDIIEKDAIETLINAGFIVVSVGGGGIPVVKEDGKLKGVEAVIDKDLASSLLARIIDAKYLIISTAVEKVYLNYTDEKNRKPLDKLTYKEAEKYMQEGHFLAGSMQPKIKAALKFLDREDKYAIITTPDKIHQAIKGEAGTILTYQSQIPIV